MPLAQQAPLASSDAPAGQQAPPALTRSLAQQAPVPSTAEQLAGTEQAEPPYPAEQAHVAEEAAGDDVDALDAESVLGPAVTSPAGALATKLDLASELAVHVPCTHEAVPASHAQAPAAQARRTAGLADAAQLASRSVSPDSAETQRVVRVCVPPPQLAEQALQGPEAQTPTSHAAVLQASSVSAAPRLATHSASEAALHSALRLAQPPPHVALQAPQAP